MKGRFIAILIVVRRLVFDLKFLGDIVPIIVACMLSIASLFALGFLITAVYPNMRAANAVANLAYFPMLFLSGATVPLEIMPEFMLKISKIFPATYAVSLQKGVWLGDGLPEYKLEIIVLLAVLVASAAVSAKTFRWE
ncbi:MAG: ABC transporter permease [Bacillota bacterium]